jgi:Lipopolysaccharide-assembly
MVFNSNLIGKFRQSSKIPVVKRVSLEIIFLFVTAAMVNFTGCCVYSFTGASVPQHLKTIAIPISEDRSGSGEPGLKELLTDQLVQQFTNDNTLQVTEKVNADAILDCVILPFTDVPAVITGNETIQVRRITINVQVTYKDLVERKTIFDKKFSEYSDYPATGSISDRKNAIEAAIGKISEDILLDTVSGW